MLRKNSIHRQAARGTMEKWAFSASSFAHEATCEVTRAAAEIHGGMGVMRELPIEMYLRNAYNMLHSDGGIIVKKLKVMSRLSTSAQPGSEVDLEE